jgi:SAM-dependent methyltransferase
MGEATRTASRSLQPRWPVQADLLRRLMRAAPFQPATNLWRAIEIPVLAGALPQTGAALDLGCGDGVLTELLREVAVADWRLVGVDSDSCEAAAARNSGIYERVHAASGDSIDEPNSSFDLAFANSVLEHVKNLPDCLREIGRCLRPGGMLAATVPSPAFRELLSGPGRWARRTRGEYLTEIDRRLAHVNYWPAERWRSELAAAGFDLPKFTSYLSERQLRRWEAWSHWTGGLLYRLRRGRRQPIAIQRSLGLRRSLPSSCAPLATSLAAAIGRGMIDDVAESGGACWLIVAERSEVRV